MILVSVLLPVFNGAGLLASAIESILAQTYADFELIVVNDGSSDDSSLVARGFSDPRIRIIDLPTNGGLINALNVGLDEARGEFVARMDHDDIAHPERLERQVSAMFASGAIICGSAIQPFGAIRGKSVAYPLNDAAIRASLPVISPFAHPAVMMRSQVCKRLGYAMTARHCEDYDLWWRISEQGQMINLPDVLLHYRHHSTQVSVTQRAAQLCCMAKIAADNLHRTGRIRSDADLLSHKKALSYGSLSTLCELEAVGDWLYWLRNSYDEVADEVSGHYLRVWRGVCSRQPHLGHGVWKIYRRFRPRGLSLTSADMVVLLTTYGNLSVDNGVVRTIRKLLRK